MQGFIDVNTLSERDIYVAEELYKRDVIRKVKKGENIGYKTYPQKTKL